jgi:mono/diheme cytochrome c family protein
MADLEPLGKFYGPNLTPGGHLKDWSDGEIVRAIREGISKDGRPLIVMPSLNFKNMPDEDVEAVVAYLRSQPAVEGEKPRSEPNFLATMLLGSGQVALSNQPPVRDVKGPPRGPTAEYGKYLATIGDCFVCHGAALDGQGQPMGAPKGPSLRIVKGWTEEQFFRTFREGVDPSGHQLADTMPWKQYGRGTDEDLKALYEFLKTVQ